MAILGLTLRFQLTWSDVAVPIPKRLSARTVRYTHAVLCSALQQAVKWRLLAYNPADSVELV